MLLDWLAEPAALAIHLEDVAAVGRPVQQGRHHVFALEHLAWRLVLVSVRSPSPHGFRGGQGAFDGVKKVSVATGKPLQCATCHSPVNHLETLF